MSLVGIHDRLSITILMFCIVLAVWGAIRFLRKQGLSGSYWGAVVIAEVVILMQGALGVYLWFIGCEESR